MAFFKFRKGGDESVATPAQTESVEALRRRARHRLIGAAVLVLVGVVGFPLVFDTQPRPIAVDIPIEIPDRNKVKPLTPPPASPSAQAPAVAGPVTPPTPAVAAAPAKQEVAKAEPVAAPPVAAAKPEPKAEPKPEAKPEPKPPAPQPKPAAVPPKPDEAQRAKALLEGKPTEAQASAVEGRFVVQVGAFADATKAHEARQKVERAGLKTYTQVAETKDGKRIRVRVGPFATRAEADRAAQKIKGLDMPAAILTL